MSAVAQNEQPPASREQIPQRHAVSVQAMVSGLGASPIPLVIRDISRRGMYLVFDDHAAAIDERWLTPGAALTIDFTATLNGQRLRMSVQAQIRRRDQGGLGVRLSQADEPTLAALRSLVMEAMAIRDTPRVQTPRSAEPASKAEQTITQVEALLQQYMPAVLDAYLNGVALSLVSAKYSTTVVAEQRRYLNLLAMFEKSQARIQHTAGALLMAEFGAYIRSDTIDASHHSGHHYAGGLSLVDSLELRASLAITEAVDRIGALLMGPWEELAQRMAQLSSRALKDNPLHPGAICFRLRNAIFDDPALGALRQIDLTAGFTPAFAEHMETLFRAMNTTLERCGLHATPSKRVTVPKDASTLKLQD